MSKLRVFIERAKYAYKNAKHASALLKKQGFVLLPDGSVLLDPRRGRTLESYGLEVVSIPPADDLDEFEDEFGESEAEALHAAREAIREARREH